MLQKLYGYNSCFLMQKGKRFHQIISNKRDIAEGLGHSARKVL